MSKQQDEILTLRDNGMGQRGVVLHEEMVDTDNVQSAEFVVRNDDTDHVAFYCPRCNKEASISNLAYYKATTKLDNPTQTLYFELYCTNCRSRGHKKMYPNLKLGDVNWH